MKYPIVIPFLGPNDDTCTISKWHTEAGKFIKKGELICTIETTKTNIDIEAQQDGYLTIFCKEGSFVKEKQPIGKIELGQDSTLLTDVNERVIDIKITKKAQYLMSEHSLRVEDISPQNGSLIRESDVLNHITHKKIDANKIEISFSNLTFSKKSLLIIGAGHGNLAAISYFKEHTNYDPVAMIFYGDKKPLIRSSDLPIFSQEYLKKFYDAGCVNIFMYVPYEQLNFFQEKITMIGYELVSFIHPTSVIASSAKIGKSVYILENSIVGPDSVIEDFVYLGPSSTVGSNVRIEKGAMILNSASVAHDSIIKNGCLISDGARVAGRVLVEKQTLVGLNSTINANVKIGERCIINSGANAYKNIESNFILNRNGELIKKKL